MLRTKDGERERAIAPIRSLTRACIAADHSGALPVETMASGRVMARAFAESTVEADRLTLARSFCYRLVTTWWRALANSDGSSPGLRAISAPFKTADLDPSARALADTLGEAAAELDAETSAYNIGLIYTCMLPRAHRARLGIYYTPPALAARLISQATASGVDWTTCRVLDPACGGGAFLAPVARRILDELPDCSPRILIRNIANRLRGYEIDPFGGWLAQVTLDAVLLPVTRDAKSTLPVVVTVCDSLRENPPRNRFDLVIGNPPYGRVRLEPAERARFRRSLFGHANLYGLFTDMAIRHARSGGVIAYVTPTSFVAGEYFKKLRDLLGREAPPATFDFVSTRKGVFDDVLQETVLATYKRRSHRTPVSVHEVAPIYNGHDLTVKESGIYALPPNPSEPWILPRCSRQSNLATVLSRMRYRLEHWGYKVSTGPLVWNRHKDQLSTCPGRNRYPLIWAEAVTPDGCFIWRAQKKNHTLWFEVRDGDDWLTIQNNCVLLQRTTAKEQSHRLIAAALPQEFLNIHRAVVVENHLNMLRPLTDQPAISPEVLAAFLNSMAADRAFRCVGGSVAVSAYELEALPIPDPEDLHILSGLVHGGGDRSQIETECARLYDAST